MIPNRRQHAICERFAYSCGEVVVGEFIWTDPPPGRRVSRIGPAGCWIERGI